MPFYCNNLAADNSRFGCLLRSEHDEWFDRVTDSAMAFSDVNIIPWTQQRKQKQDRERVSTALHVGRKQKSGMLISPGW